MKIGLAACLLCLGVIQVWMGELRAQEPLLPVARIAQDHFGNDAAWYRSRIPFFEIDDAAIEQVYYYRWTLYRSHLREIGAQGTTVTEFLNDVPWAREPYTDLNDSAAFHLMEGRWLRDPRTVDDLIDHLYAGGGNDRHFSEWIAAASEATTLVTGDANPALKHLDTMQHIYNLWDDHFDRSRGLYWIEPLADATEYTISSIDASGAGFTDHPSQDQNHNGFTRGEAFRPSINAYQYGNAMAISRLAAASGLRDVSALYTERARALQASVMAQLWNPTLEHFVDRYQRSTPTVKEGDFVRGRELVGYVPWMFGLVPQGDGVHGAAWRHALAPEELNGRFGLRTVEPSYPRYMVQYRYDTATGKPECQWNGPSWPFQTAEALTAMSNELHDDPAAVVTRADYVQALRRYTAEHLEESGKPDLEEDYNPDTGKPIVGLGRSHHYNHSTYIDLLMTGLVGIRPRADDVLEIDPLLPSAWSRGVAPIRYFALQDVAYHGHRLGVYYDAEGSRYRLGMGLKIFVDGHLLANSRSLKRIVVRLPRTGRALRASPRRVDVAVNVGVPDGPVATASSAMDGRPPAEAIDGRMWFFTEVQNGWSPRPEDAAPWLAIHLVQPQRVGSVALSFLEGDDLRAPSAFRLERETALGWQEIAGQMRSALTPVGNGENVIRFPAVEAQDLRLTLQRADGGIRLVEMKVFAK